LILCDPVRGFRSDYERQAFASELESNESSTRCNTNLSHYRIVCKIGAGGTGEVYLAQDSRYSGSRVCPTKVGTLYAVKSGHYSFDPPLSILKANLIIYRSIRLV